MEEKQPKRTKPLHGKPKGGVTRAQAQPNPFGEYSIHLTDTNNGPKMQMLRERTKEGDLAVIQFDSTPSDEVKAKLTAAGLSSHDEACVWKKHLGTPPGVEHRKTQELFEIIANDIRKANGLEPVLTPENRLI